MTPVSYTSAAQARHICPTRNQSYIQRRSQLWTTGREIQQRSRSVYCITPTIFLPICYVSSLARGKQQAANGLPGRFVKRFTVSLDRLLVNDWFSRLFACLLAGLTSTSRSADGWAYQVLGGTALCCGCCTGSQKQGLKNESNDERTTATTQEGEA